MSRPFLRIMGDQELGSRSQAGTGNGIGNGVGTGVRGWWRNSGGTEGRRESMNSNESAPKSPSQGNEMVSVSSNFAGLSPVITPGGSHARASNSTVSPGLRSNSTLFVPQPLLPVDSTVLPERPRPAPMRSETIGTVMVEVLQPQHQEQAQPQRPADVEAQQTISAEKGRWWWQRGLLTGLQTKVFTCLVTGIFLVITLAIYLGLSLDHALQLRHEWQILLIFVTLVATVFFCYALVQLCIVVTSPLRLQRASRNSNFSRIPSVSGPDGYANPRQPIQIQSNFEHDVDGVEPDLTKMPPPVYGLWRCSVRVNPDQFYWVRQQSAISGGREPTSPTSGRVIPRPPSYASDDGSLYAYNSAGPDSSLPPHPSEVRRV